MKMVPDPRCGRKTKHELAEVLTCLVLGFLAGRTTIRRSLNWCRSHLEILRVYMPLENGIASPPTACRLLAGIDEWMFLYAFMEWVGEIIPTRGRHIVIDRKALRGSVEKVKGNKASMVLNALDAETGLVLAQIPIQEKTNEITAIPEILKLFSLRGSTITTDSIGTQTEIMLQIREQEGHFVLLVKGNQPQTYEEILKFMGEARDDYAAQKKETDTAARPRYPEIMESYGEWSGAENNRDRKEHRHCCVTNEKGIITKTETEWPWIETVGLLRQIRIPMERDENGEDITPDVETFLKEGSRRKPKPQKGDNEKSDIQEVGLISDLKLSAEKVAVIKRKHWSVENKLHHALDDTFREDRSPAKKCRNNLALIRKFAYNILRLAQNAKEGADVMTEMMDFFCDDPSLMQKYVFQGIKSQY
ncbi:MAG: ISAs1 family transposase [Lachnospiraceae bacterium]|nr:ISAs1 family transposase [Lachnospiraceae bacterium]